MKFRPLHQILVVVVSLAFIGGSRLSPDLQKRRWIADMTYPPAPFTASVKPIDTVESTEIMEVSLPSPLKTASAANNEIHGIYFRPKSPRPGAVIVLPIMQSPNLMIERIVARYLSARGFRTFIMPLPYQQSRGADIGATSILSLMRQSAEPQKIYDAGRQGVMDARRVREWLIRDEAVPPDRIGIAGISLGSLVASVTYSVDPDFRAAALVLSGGDLGTVIWNDSRETHPVRAAMEAAGHDLTYARQLTAPFDPLTYATPDRREGLLMINALDDEVFPRSASDALAAAYGNPEQVYLRGNHYSVALSMPTILQKVYEHFAKTLDEPATPDSD